MINNNVYAGRNPDCVTKTQIGNTILVASGYLNPNAAETAIDKMKRVLETEAIVRLQKPA